jgi:hypothetical protein
MLRRCLLTHAAAGSAAPLPRSSRDCFVALGLDPATKPHQYTDGEIKAAYRVKARTCHPDMVGGDETLFRNVKFAFDYLRVRPGCVASNADIDSGAAPRGFYDHPHHTTATRARQAQATHTTRTRWDEDLKSGVYEDPDPQEAFVRYATEWGDAVRQGRGNEYINNRREEFRKKRQAAEEAKYGEDAYGKEKRERDRLFNRVFFVKAFGKWTMVFGTAYILWTGANAHFRRYEDFHTLNAYPKEYIESLASIPNPNGKLQPIEAGVRTLDPAAAERVLFVAKMKAMQEDFARRVDQDRPRSSYSVARKYKGQPFTPEGVHAAAVADRDRAKRKAAKKTKATATADSPGVHHFTAAIAAPVALTTLVSDVPFDENACVTME